MASLAESLSWIQTNDDGRNALGVITLALSNAYKVLPQVSTDQGLQDTARSFLDDANTYAQKIFADIPQNGDDMSIWNAGRIGICASESDEAINGVTDAAGVSRFDFASSIQQASKEISTDISAGAKAVGDVAGAAAASPFQGIVAAITSLLYGARVFLIIAGGVLIVYVFRKPLFGAVKKVGG